jgi:MGT family glycosyltransferase
MRTAYLFNGGAHGHVNPTLGLVAELVRRGQRVIYYCSDDFRQLIERTGAIYRPYPMPEPDEPITGVPHFVTLFLRSSVLWLPGLIAQAREDKPDYVIYDMFRVWGLQLARYLNIPAICVNPTIMLNGPVQQAVAPDFLALSEADQDPRVTTDYRAEYERLASTIKEQYGVATPAMFDTFPLPGDLTLCFTLRRLQPAADQLDDTVQFVGLMTHRRPADPSFPLERLNDRPVVFVSLGTVFNNQPAFFRRCAEALSNSEYTVVMAVGNEMDVAALGELPPNVIVRRWVPQQEILPLTDVFISHSGMGSVQEALLHGVPLVCYPQMIEQSIIARQLAALGAARLLGTVSGALVADPTEMPTPAQIHAAVEQVQRDPSYKARAQALGEELRRCSAAHAADIVQRFVVLPIN